MDVDPLNPSTAAGAPQSGHPDQPLFLNGTPSVHGTPQSRLRGMLRDEPVSSSPLKNAAARRALGMSTPRIGRMTRGECLFLSLTPPRFLLSFSANS